MSQPARQTALEEALARVDQVARRSLWRAPDADATAMLRMWGELVDSAADLWAALPGGSIADQDIMAQLQTTAQTYHRAQLATGWPGDGSFDGPLLRAAEDLTRAAAQTHGAQPQQARAQVMHALYLAAHAVGRSLHAQLSRDLDELTTTGSGDPNVSRLAGAWRRLQAMENLAGDYLNRISSSPSHSARSRGDGTARVAHALAAWDITAHRTLSAHPAPANVTMVCAVQEIVVSTALEHVRRNSWAWRLDPLHQGGRLIPSLQDALHAWTDARRAWSRLTPEHARADHDLALAAAQLRQNLIATSPTRRHRQLDDREFATMTTVVRHTGTSVDLASMIADIAATDPDLRIGALVAARHIGRAQDLALDSELPQPPDHGLTERQVRLNEVVPLPRSMREELMDVANGVVANGLSAASARGALDPPVVPRHHAITTTAADPSRPIAVQNQLWSGQVPEPGR